MARISVIPRSSLPPAEPAVPRVLVVDGGSQLVPRLRDALESFCEVHVCHDSEPVAEVIHMLAADLVLLDLRASAGSAFELCGELRATDAGSGVPILLVGDDSLDEQTVTRGLLCGADDVLVSAQHRVLELQARVRVQLRNKRDRDRLRRVRAERDNYRLEATLDALTGIPNRRTFDRKLTSVCREDARCALLFVDVDHFKRINDALGHDVGDKVLQAVAQCLDRARRPTDIVARYGGEEFVLVLRDVDARLARDEAERIRASVEKLTVPPWLRAGTITVSVGLTLRTAEDTDPSRLCKRADEALYEAKRRGRNRVVERWADDEAVERPSTSMSELEAYLLKQIATGRAGLPLLPEAAQEALRLAEDPSTDIARIAKLVDRDPPLAARFVALAGSAAYSSGLKPTSTHAALVRVGLQASRDLLLQVVYERASTTLPTFRSEVAKCFDRSVRAAHAARHLARVLSPAYDLAYLCGLLHDIGEARVYRILAEAPASAKLRRDAVETLVQRHHGLAGAEVARAWNLPTDIVHACEQHHGPLERAPLAVRLVMGADALERLSQHTTVACRDASNPDVALLLRLGVPAPTVGLLVEGMRRTLEALANPDAIDLRG
jgi:diguanylate cyclase (GGDEF)-like protein/putative nucleotidyltransferase with HDIG domain